VSSILKALKKLEQEAAEKAGVPLPSGAGKPYQKKNMLVPALGVVILCILIAFGTAMLIKKSSAPESVTTVLENEKSVPAVKTPAAIIPEDTVVESGMQHEDKPGVLAPDFKFSTAGPERAGKTQPHPEKETASLPGEQTKNLPAPPPGTVQTAKSSPPVMALPDALSESRPSAIKNPKPAAVLQPDATVGKSSPPESTGNRPASKSVEKKTESLVPVINDPALELQAISWSANSEKRMAIINGKICREKDRVGGYVIVAINSGDVVLSKGSVKGKLMFEIR